MSWQCFLGTPTSYWLEAPLQWKSHSLHCFPLSFSSHLSGSLPSGLTQETQPSCLWECRGDN